MTKLTPRLDRVLAKVVQDIDRRAAGLVGDPRNETDTALELRAELLEAYDEQKTLEDSSAAVLVKAEALLLNYVGSPEADKWRMIVELGEAWQKYAGEAP